MAVYTEVGFAEADALLRRLGLGALTELRGIRSGIENTNYYATTARGQWVVTLFERLSRDELPYYLALMQHLAQHGIPVPAPQADADGGLLHTLAGKPAAVVTRLPGSHRLSPEAPHCAQVGEMLARAHLAVADLPLEQPHLRGLDWWAATVPEVLPFVDAAQAALLQDELAFQRQLAASAAGQALPRGAIHADLFRDNVMFDETAGEDRLCGFFDYYFAGTDTLLFDIAVCLNDWCADLTTAGLDEERALAFMAAYQAVRPLTHAEIRLMPGLLRAAALRFWLSRLRDWHLPRDAALLQPKDPAHFERLLRDRIDNPWHPPATPSS
ncbi:MULTISPECIES: homoserine kinase [Rubrivivax]|uniref:Homoserine kinase n=1 Tax=Rubrivivax benzoatilyticus TaxID=316997 RepID=A0ABX0HXI5_9BURK|nr:MULTISPECIES: homoserine kinase [Rubrivivax]EGJ10518.1 homoserine kinase [Rubrivivax benzoatilyticus JA2 = ATCC BAA-35]NHK99115.1 homoserine kinase [Rubrivivax benzoatilyticus]NHL25022.1 homoserine kinase [Rubrivivax benzoatilyticus]